MGQKQSRPLISSASVVMPTASRVKTPATRRKRVSTINKACVIITTYNRPEQMEALMRDLVPYGGTIDVIIYDDASDKDYSAVASLARRNRWRYIRFPYNHGKHKFWTMINTIFTQIKATQPYSHYILLQDDIRLCQNFVPRVMSVWDAIKDPQKISLLLLKDNRGSGGISIWTKRKIRDCGHVSKVHFVDFPALICSREFFEALSWHIHPIPVTRWADRPHLSTGVGAQISQRFCRSGLSMYRTNQSYVLHHGVQSELNCQARQNAPLCAIDFVDEYVTASIASIPSRQPALKSVVKRLLPQVDHINVYLNGYKHVPEFLNSDKITVARSQKHGDRGDAGKFFCAGKIDGFHFTCDDDIIYPTDYVKRTIDRINKYDKKAVVGYHAAILSDKLESYYGSRRSIHFKGAVNKDRPVHVLGTGTVAYHSSTIKVSRRDFKCPNMADVWFAKLGQEQKVPFMCLSRKANWLRPQKVDHDDSIYRKSKHKSGGGKDTGRQQTKIAKAIAPWRLYTL